MARISLLATFRGMNEVEQSPLDTASALWDRDDSVAGLARLISADATGAPSYSICATCGSRIEGTAKRKYCGRQCANKALLVRRRIARTRMIERLTR
jgi:hypothetical protein